MSEEVNKTTTFPASYKSLAAISKFVTAGAEAAGLDDKAAYAVRLAVDEACTNIIEHAYAGMEAMEAQGITCSYRVSDKALTITLRDRGRPFNLDEVPEPDICSPLEERQIGGLGVYFIHEMMDEVYFSCNPDGSNTLKLVKHRS